MNRRAASGFRRVDLTTPSLNTADRQNGSKLGRNCRNLQTKINKCMQADQYGCAEGQPWVDEQASSLAPAAQAKNRYHSDCKCQCSCCWNAELHCKLKI